MWCVQEGRDSVQEGREVVHRKEEGGRERGSAQEGRDIVQKGRDSTQEGREVVHRKGGRKRVR